MTKPKQVVRTSHGLRDILFEEIDRMRSDQADPTRAAAIANLSKQIIATAKVELEFHRTMANLGDKGHPVSLGTLALGSA